MASTVDTAVCNDHPSSHAQQWWPVKKQKALFGVSVLGYLFGLISGLIPAHDQLLTSGPKSKRKLRGDCAFAVLALKLWNDLPLHVKQASSLSVFISRLKTHLFFMAFET